MLDFLFSNLVLDTPVIRIANGGDELLADCGSWGSYTGRKLGSWISPYSFISSYGCQTISCGSPIDLSCGTMCILLYSGVTGWIDSLIKDSARARSWFAIHLGYDFWFFYTYPFVGWGIWRKGWQNLQVWTILLRSLIGTCGNLCFRLLQLTWVERCKCVAFITVLHWGMSARWSESWFPLKVSFGGL